MKIEENITLMKMNYLYEMSKYGRSSEDGKDIKNEIAQNERATLV